MLTDLATLTDLQNRLGRDLTTNEHRLATTLLHDASAAVRLYTGQQFTLELDDDDPPAAIPSVVKLRVRRGKIRLPQRPVVSVDSVTVTAFDLTETPVAFRWDGIETLYVGSNVLDPFAWEPFRTDVNVVTVTYVHGYAELPPALVALVTQIVGRALGAELIQTGITSETIGGYQYQLGGAAAAGGFGLLPNEKDALDRFRRVGGMVEVGP